MAKARMARDRIDDGSLLAPAIYAAHLVELVTSRWTVPKAKLLEGTNLVAEELQDPDARIDSTTMGQLILRSIELTREPGLGFYFGLHVKLSAHGAVGLAAMTSATLRDALEVGARYFSLRTGHTAMSYSVEGDTVVVEFREVAPLGATRVFVMDSLMTEFTQMARTLVGFPITGTYEIRHPEPKHFQGFAHLLAGPVRFERPADRFLLPARFLDAPLVLSDSLATARAIERCEHDLAMLDETSSLLLGVRRQMRSRSAGFPSLTELADKRRVSTRTLKRQLAAHGTSFQRLLDELRRDRALALLASGEVAVERIATQLGYSDPSNFNRAFKRWMGESPSSFRERELAGAAQTTSARTEPSKPRM